MTMMEKYPFGFDWTGYSNLEMCDIAHSDMNEFDRQDMKAFVEIMAGRLEYYVAKFGTGRERSPSV